MGRFRIGIAVLLALGVVGCQRGQKSREVAALDDAYKAGVITKAEYDAKTAALVSHADSLAALDKARDAGLLTPAEYQEHKQRLTATAATSATVAPIAQNAAPTAAPAMDRASASPSMPPAAASAPNAAAVTGVRQENIVDPGLQMNAYTVNVPANWKFNGAYEAGSSCAQIPFPVFRAYSPDGLTEVRRLPRFDWFWTTSRFKGAPHADCLDIKEDMSAQNFIKYLVGVLQVAYVRDFPVPQEMKDNYQKTLDSLNAMGVNNAKQMDQMNASLPSMKGRKVQPPVQRGELAAAIVEYRNGSFTIEQQIWVKTMCMHAAMNYGPEPDAFSESCNATVRLVRAPKGQLDGVLAMIQSQNIGAGENAEWASRYMQAQAARAKAQSDQMFRESNALMAQRQAEFERGQAVRAQQHQQFMATMQAGTDRSMANARAIANSNHAMAQDWCDYALDRQTVTGPGGTVKASSAYNNTWTDGSGHYYQTNYSNIDPNGSLPGNWTLTTQVHGDGTAK